MSEPASLLIVAEDDGLRSRAPTADDIADELDARATELRDALAPPPPGRTDGGDDREKGR